jgi:hypothetical protein
MAGSISAAPQPLSIATPSLRWATDGPAVFQLVPGDTQILPGPFVSFTPPPTDLPPEIRRAMVTFQTAANVSRVTNMARRFDHYLPESLNNLVWTNFLANTNNKSMVIWSTRTRPPNWPARPALVRWNPNSLIWGAKGLTAICPCWQWEGPPGSTPITALTRRHGYARGHAMGSDRFGTDLAGKKVWFLTTNNSIVETRIRRLVVRTRETSRRDYTLFLFDSDLPPSIEPMRVVAASEVFAVPHCKYCYIAGTPSLLFKTEQGGNVSADVPGFTVDTMKGGDSGSPNMLPLPGELVFWNGRTTSGPSPEMQADMDELCKLQRLNPAKYQLQYVDLSKYPTY